MVYLRRPCAGHPRRDRLIALAQPPIDSMRWHGLRVVAADGSRMRVGTRRGHELRADHYAFALFLPGAELTLHAALHPADGVLVCELDRDAPV